jgi:putative endonuclease
MKKLILQIKAVECPERPREFRGEVEGQCFVYLLLCKDLSLYCGSSFDLKHKIKEHNSGKASLWTKNRKPVKLVYFEIHESLLSARRREKQIKGWTIRKKLNLINGVWKLQKNKL